MPSLSRHLTNASATAQRATEDDVAASSSTDTAEPCLLKNTHNHGVAGPVTSLYVRSSRVGDDRVPGVRLDLGVVERVVQATAFLAHLC
jgi:hypothetical protein